jgi:hypothetical protein
MHDNLLGNIATVSIESRNFPAGLKAELIALVPDAYETRGVFSGEQGAVGGAAHDSVRAFDYDRGWERPDYVDRFFGAVDGRASDDRNMDGVDEQMSYGNGNPTGGFSIVRHEGAGAELALKIKQRGGADYAPVSTDADGTAHYHVPEGAQPGSPNRAAWNFDFAGTILAAGDDAALTFKLFVDLDPTEAVNLVAYAPNDNPANPYSTQNSGNYAFIDVDPLTQGLQNYGFGDAEFDIVLKAYDGGVEIASNTVVVHVDGFGL